MLGAAGMSQCNDPSIPTVLATKAKLQPTASAGSVRDVVMTPATAGITSKPNTSNTPAICTEDVTTTPKSA